MQDCVRTCLKKQGFVSMKNVPKCQLPGIGASVLCYSWVEYEITEQKYDVDEAFVLLCCFQEFFKGTMFSSSNLHMNHYIANGVLSALQNNANNVRQRNDVSKTFQAILKLVNYSSILQKTFHTKFNEGVSSRMKGDNEHNFNMLVDSIVFARKTREAKDILGSTTLSYKKKAYEKLYGQCTAEVRSKYREAKNLRFLKF